MQAASDSYYFWRRLMLWTAHFLFTCTFWAGSSTQPLAKENKNCIGTAHFILFIQRTLLDSALVRMQSIYTEAIRKFCHGTVPATPQASSLFE